MVMSRLHLAYGLMSFCQAVLHNLFLVYHVDVFVSVFKISQSAFWLGEAIFLIWNSLNDSLFGWFSDSSFLKSDSSSSSGLGTVSRRISAIERCGPLFAASFLLVWYAWPWPGLQFVFCLCLYDGFLTVIDLHHSALLADMAVTLPDRTRLEFACSVFNAAGTMSLFASYFVWDRGDLSSFRVVCTILAIASAAGFVVSAKVMKTASAQMSIGSSKKDDDVISSGRHVQDSHAGRDSHSSWMALKLFSKQIYHHKNFKWFTSMNLLQVFHCHFNSNFFPLFLEHMLGDSVSAWTSASLLSVSFVLPHINNLFFLSLCRTYGVYAVVRGLFALKILMAVGMILAGSQNFFLLCVFIMSNRVFTEGTCKLLNLVISDLVDEDYVIHARRTPISALMFGTTALLTKPGQSLAPLMGIWLLTRLTGHSPFADQKAAVDPVLADNPLVVDGMSAVAQGWSHLGPLLDMQTACFYILVAIPLLCGLLQLVLWSQFTLHGARLASIKRHRMMADSSGSATREPV
eukprot:scpid44646/ scgid32311/ Transmembrane protein 180